MSEFGDRPAGTGGCLCGAVRYRVDGPLRSIIACHCGQCRRMSGHHTAATAAARGDLEIDSSGALAWYESSPGVRRGFCQTCGSSLFWDNETRDYVAIFAGSLDSPTGLKLVQHIHTADKGDYYEIADGLPALPGWMAEG
ncbi:MAG: GFA family protein [Kiloniellales bacterium]